MAVFESLWQQLCSRSALVHLCVFKVHFLPIFSHLYCSYISSFFFHSGLFSFLLFFLIKLALFIKLDLKSLAQLVLLPSSDGEYVCIVMAGSANIFLLFYRNNIFLRYVWFLCWKVKCSGFLFGFVLVLF